MFQVDTGQGHCQAGSLQVVCMDVSKESVVVDALLIMIRVISCKRRYINYSTVITDITEITEITRMMNRFKKPITFVSLTNQSGNILPHFDEVDCPERTSECEFRNVTGSKLKRYSVAVRRCSYSLLIYLFTYLPIVVLRIIWRAQNAP